MPVQGHAHSMQAEFLLTIFASCQLQFNVPITRVGKFMTQCQKPGINPGFMTSCPKPVYGSL